MEFDAELFSSRTKKAEAFAKRSPRAYALATLAFARLGILYVLFWALMALAAAVALVWIGRARPEFLKIGWLLALFAYLLLKAMWLRFSPPEGVAVTPKEAPVLFAEIEALRSAERVPSIARVLIDDEFNASVVMRPRFGFLAGQENTLVLGLPLLLALDPKHARAVIAHELGHIGGRHGRLGAMLYRARYLWQEVLTAFEAQKGVVSFVFRGFFRWYVPRFEAYAHVLLREQELEADRASARTAGTAIAAGTLVAIRVYRRCLSESLWDGMGLRPRNEPEPPAELSRLIQDTLAHAKREDLSAWRDEALRRETAPSDTHPSLRKRLEAMGQTADLPPLPSTCAAEALLGPSYESVRRRIDEAWRGSVREQWMQEHAEWQARLDRLAELDARAARGELADQASADEAFERADLVEDLRSAEEAVLILEEHLQRHPKHFSARFMLGRLLLAAGQREGISHLETVMADDPRAEPPACDLIAGFLEQQGEAAEAGRYATRAEQRQAEMKAFDDERAVVFPKDALEPHGLAPELVSALVSDLDADPDVKRAFLAKKLLHHRPEEDPVYVLAVELRTIWRRSWYLGLAANHLDFLMRGGDPGGAVVKRLRLALKPPFRLSIILVDGQLRELGRKVKKTSGSAVYRRGHTPVAARKAALAENQHGSGDR